MSHVNRVFIGGLNDVVKKEDVEAEFGRFGKISNVWVAFNPPGFGFMEFDTIDAAETAVDHMNGADFMGCKLRVELSRNQDPFHRGGGRGGPRGGGGRSFGSRGGSGGYRSGRGGGRDFNDYDDNGRGGNRGRSSYRGSRGSGGFGYKSHDEDGGYDNYDDDDSFGRGGGGSYGDRDNGYGGSSRSRGGGFRDGGRGGRGGDRPLRGGGSFRGHTRTPRFSGNGSDDNFRSDFGGDSRADRYRSRSPNARR